MVARRLNARTMEEKLKLHWTTAKMAAHFNMDEEQLIASIMKNFGQRKGEEYLSRMCQNDKMAKKLNKKHESRETSTAENLSETSVVETETVVANENNEEIATTEKENSPIHVLELESAKLSVRIIDIESRRKKLFSENCELRNKLSDERNYLKKILDTFEKHKNACSSIIEKIENNYEAADGLYQELLTYRKQQHELEEQIANLKTVNIFIYSNGEIEVENGEFKAFENWVDIYNTLTQMNEVEDGFTLKQLKSIAKLRSFVMNLSDDVPYTITFDSNEIENVYNILKA